MIQLEYAKRLKDIQFSGSPVKVEGDMNRHQLSNKK
jgi:hypothetical protein